MGQEMSITLRMCLQRRGFINENLNVEGSRCFDLKNAADREEVLDPAALTDEFVTILAEMDVAQVEVCEGEDCNSTPESDICSRK